MKFGKKHRSGCSHKIAAKIHTSMSTFKWFNEGGSIMVWGWMNEEGVGELTQKKKSRPYIVPA